MGTRSGVGERARETCLGFRIKFTKNYNVKETRPDIRRKGKKEDLDMRYGLSTTTKYRNKTTRKIDKVQATCLQYKRDVRATTQWLCP